MARYIDANVLIKVIDAMADMDMGTPKLVFLSVQNMVNCLPPADVAPRAEIAKEIFEEIRDLIRFTMEPYSETLYAKIEFEKLEAIRKKYTDPELQKGGHHE